jgi:hypothetical protein
LVIGSATALNNTWNNTNTNWSSPSSQTTLNAIWPNTGTFTANFNSATIPTSILIPSAITTIPNNINIGQNIIPPPIPQNAEINAPNQPILISIVMSLNETYKSPGTNLYPHSFFSLYSSFIILIDTIKNIIHNKFRIMNRDISYS